MSTSQTALVAPRQAPVDCGKPGPKAPSSLAWRHVPAPRVACVHAHGGRGPLVAGKLRVVALIRLIYLAEEVSRERVAEYQVPPRRDEENVFPECVAEAMSVGEARSTALGSAAPQALETICWPQNPGFTGSRPVRRGPQMAEGAGGLGADVW